MLATRWFETIVFVLCAALLTDFCRCATVTKEAGLELKDDFNEDFDNDFGKGASTEDTEYLAEVHHDDDEEDAEDLPEDEGADDGEDNGEQDTEDRDYVGEDKDDENEDESIYCSKNNVAKCILEKYGVSGVGKTPKKRRACVHSKSPTVLMR